MNARHNKLSQPIIASFRILYRVKAHMDLFEFGDIPNIWPNIGLPWIDNASYSYP